MSNVRLTMRAHYTIDGLEPSLSVAITFDPLDAESVLQSQTLLMQRVVEGVDNWSKEVEAWATAKLESGEWKDS